MLIQIDTAKVCHAERTLRQSSEILSGQIKRLRALENKVYEAWYSEELTLCYIDEIRRMCESLEKLHRATDEQADACADVVSRVREMEAAGGGSGGGRF